MERKLPQVERRNENGYCWTCVKRKRVCDQALPCCKTCTDSGLKCRGYGIRLCFPSGIIAGLPKPKKRIRADSNRSTEGSSTAAPTTGTDSAETSKARTTPHRDIGIEWSTFSDDTRFCLTAAPSPLPTEDNFYLQHFLHNFARVALAIDYDKNGYRFLLPVAMQEPGLLSAILAVAASHYSRWQKKADTTSRKYRQKALQSLRDRFIHAELVHSPVTLCCMLALVTYEVFQGSSRWRGHHEAIRGWVRSRSDYSDLDPFLKAWVCLIDTQRALNTGFPVMPEVGHWMEESDSLLKETASIDPLFGCASSLPKLMWEASKLYSDSKDMGMSAEDVGERADRLQNQIYSTKILDDCEPSVMMMCQHSSDKLSVVVDLDKDDLRRRMVATAEIFRHACHIYVYRVNHAPKEPLSEQMQTNLQLALDLLTLVPDAIGPGANLGWCLVVLGAEINLADQRDYIRSRWPGLDLLGIDNYKNAQSTLEEVWRLHDLVNNGQAEPKRWQDIMQWLGQTQILL